MSRKLIKTELPGYTVLVPVNTNALRDILDASICVDGHLLEHACKKIPGYREQSRPQTEDGYIWFWGHYFKTTTGGSVAILIPWAQDRNKHDGTQADRAIAVYTEGVVTMGEIGELLEMFGDEYKATMELAEQNTAANAKAELW